jgi:hypothetical protein
MEAIRTPSPDGRAHERRARNGAEAVPSDSPRMEARIPDAMAALSYGNRILALQGTGPRIS